MKKRNFGAWFMALLAWAFIIYLLTALKKKEHGSAAPSEEGNTANNDDESIAKR